MTQMALLSQMSAELLSQTPYGNLGVLPAAEDGMETVDVYQMQSQVAPELAEGLRLQDVYGTAAMPMYEFVKPVKTGTRTFHCARLWWHNFNGEPMMASPRTEMHNQLTWGQ